MGLFRDFCVFSTTSPLALTNRTCATVCPPGMPRSALALEVGEVAIFPVGKFCIDASTQLSRW